MNTSHSFSVDRLNDRKRVCCHETLPYCLSPRGRKKKWENVYSFFFCFCIFRTFSWNKKETKINLIAVGYRSMIFTRISYTFFALKLPFISRHKIEEKKKNAKETIDEFVLNLAENWFHRLTLSQLQFHHLVYSFWFPQRINKETKQTTTKKKPYRTELTAKIRTPTTNL